MIFRYPNGKRSVHQSRNEAHGQNRLNYANRGMSLEEDLNATNAYYLSAGIAVIHKKPTPVQIVSVDYPKRSAAVIKEAYFKQASTTDYNGVYRGKYIDFEAKETRNKTSFPLNNFHEHQIEHMKNVHKQAGICFVILRFVTDDTVYLLEAHHLFRFWDHRLVSGKKSIPLDTISELGFTIPLRYQPRIDYLSVIDSLYFN